MHFSKEVYNTAILKNFVRKHSNCVFEDTDSNARFLCEYIEDDTDETTSISFSIERSYLFIDMLVCTYKEDCFEICSATAKKVEVQISPVHFLILNQKILLRLSLEFAHINERRLEASVKKLFKLKHCLISPFEKAANNRLLSLDDIARIECGFLIDFEEKDDDAEEKSSESTSDHEFENNDLNELKKTAEEITADIDDDDDDDILDPSSLGPNPFRFPFFENIAKMNAERKANAIFDELESELTSNQEV